MIRVRGEGQRDQRRSGTNPVAVPVVPAVLLDALVAVAEIALPRDPLGPGRVAVFYDAVRLVFTACCVVRR